MKKKYPFLEKLTTFKLTILFIILNCLFVNADNSTIGSNVNTNGGSGLALSYGSLSSAIIALNAATINSPVIITLNVAETAPSGGYVITAQGTAINTIIIRGNNNTVTANANLSLGLFIDGIIKLVGADYVTIQDFNIQENTANTIGINSASGTGNNMTEWGIAILFGTTTNGAQNITLQRNTITLNRAYRNTFGIYCNSLHSPNSISDGISATSATGNNNGLKIFLNVISNINFGIAVVGPSIATYHNESITIGGLGLGNIITDFGTNTSVAGSGFSGVAAGGFGILVRHTDNFIISYNTIISSNGGYVGVDNISGIYVPNTNTPIGNLVQEINNNSISLRPGGINTSIIGIRIDHSTSNSNSTLSISNNDFNNTSHTIASPASIAFIYNLASSLITNINGNTFTNLTVNTSGIVQFIYNNVTHPENAVCNVNNNGIITSFNKTGSGGSVYFYVSRSVSPSSVTENNIGNNFSNINLTGPTAVIGWYSENGPKSYPFGAKKIISNNIFSNIISGSSFAVLLSVGYSSESVNSIVSNNIINNITVGGSIVGIISADGNQEFSGNVVSNLRTTGISEADGLSIENGINQRIIKNKIINLESTAGVVNGILIKGGLLNTISNNLIGNLTCPQKNSTSDGVRGISIRSINLGAFPTNSRVNIYNNTIRLNATSTGTNFSTSGIFHSTTTTPTTANLDIRNNIIVNNSIARGTGNSAAYRRSTNILTYIEASSNNNDIVAPVFFDDGTNKDFTLSSYQTRVSPRESLSISSVPNFLSILPDNINYLHIDATITSPIESGGTAIATITDDFDGDIRFGAGGYTGAGTAIDLGADEFNGPLSTTTFDNENFSIYPNPTSGILNISYSDAISEVSVINLLGQTIMTKKVNGLEVQIDLSPLSRAMYLIKVVADGQEKFIKVLKE